LNAVDGDMTIWLHVSPEAGWRMLKKFLAGDDYNQITIGMYNFTAPHIIEAVRAAIKPETRQTVMTIDRKSDDIGGIGPKKHDWSEDKLLNTLTRDVGNRFKWVAASVSGPGRLFATNYHIKVAVLGKRSGTSKKAIMQDSRFWLSSGN